MYYEKYNNQLYSIHAENNQFAIQQDTGFKFIVTLDTEENLPKYAQTEEDYGTLTQEIWGNGLIKTYSTARKYLIQNETDIPYSEAIDVPNRYTYRESDEYIPEDERHRGENADEQAER